MLLLILLIILAIILLGGGGYYYRAGNVTYGGPIGLLGIILIVVILYLLLSGRGLAQETAPVTEPDFWTGTWTQLQGPIMSLIAAIIAAVAGLIYTKVAQWTNKGVARIAQEMFQDAAMRAAGLALNSLGVKAVKEEIKISDPAVQEAVTYMHETMPDTLKSLKVGDVKLAKIILANIGKLTAPALGAK